MHFGRVPASNILGRRIKASDLAQFYWCQEQAYWQLHGVQRERTFTDTRGHQVQADLTRPAETEHEIKFFTELQKHLPVFREADGVKVFCGFDAVSLVENEKKVFLHEIKSTRHTTEIPLTTKSPAVFQLEIYYWAYRPVFEKMQYDFPDTHFLEFFNKENLTAVETIKVKMEEKRIEEKILHALHEIQHKNIFPLPEAFKCQLCPSAYKARCRGINGVQLTLGQA